MECAIVERIPALQAYGLVIVAVSHGSLGVEEEVVTMAENQLAAELERPWDWAQPAAARRADRRPGPDG